jgi:hypothetical protein
MPRPVAKLRILRELRRFGAGKMGIATLGNKSAGTRKPAIPAGVFYRLLIRAVAESAGGSMCGRGDQRWGQEAAPDQKPQSAHGYPADHEISQGK